MLISLFSIISNHWLKTNMLTTCVSVSNLKIRTNGKPDGWLLKQQTQRVRWSLIWFKFSDWQQELLQAHQYFVIYGKVNHQEITHLSYTLRSNHITPTAKLKSKMEGIYSSGEVLAGHYLHSKGLHKLISQCLSQVSERDIPETLPQYMISNSRWSPNTVQFYKYINQEPNWKSIKLVIGWSLKSCFCSTQITQK